MLISSIYLIHWSLALIASITRITIALFSINSWISLARIVLAALGFRVLTNSMYLDLRFFKKLRGPIELPMMMWDKMLFPFLLKLI